MECVWIARFLCFSSCSSGSFGEVGELYSVLVREVSAITTQLISYLVNLTMTNWIIWCSSSPDPTRNRQGHLASRSSIQHDSNGGVRFIWYWFSCRFNCRCFIPIFRYAVGFIEVTLTAAYSLGIINAAPYGMVNGPYAVTIHDWTSRELLLQIDRPRLIGSALPASPAVVLYRPLLQTLFCQYSACTHLNWLPWHFGTA